MQKRDSHYTIALLPHPSRNPSKSHTTSHSRYVYLDNKFGLSYKSHVVVLIFWHYLPPGHGGKKVSRLILWRQKSIIVFIFFCEKLEELSQLTFDELCKASGNSTEYQWDSSWVVSQLKRHIIDNFETPTYILKSLQLCFNLDSIAASLFVLNWLSWQIVSDDKIQITILILRRGALSIPIMYFDRGYLHSNSHSINERGKLIMCCYHEM